MIKVIVDFRSCAVNVEVALRSELNCSVQRLPMNHRPPAGALVKEYEL
jgi:hypothetical protein